MDKVENICELKGEKKREIKCEKPKSKYLKNTFQKYLN